MPRRIRNLQDVVDWRLCIGCGACAHACEPGTVSLVNIESEGIRPVFHGTSQSHKECLAICPGYSLDAEAVTGPAGRSRADEEFGPALEIWEGHAADPEIRFQASSGGLLTALSLYCLEREGMSFVSHIASDPAQPWLNRTVQSRTREELLSRTGSRYSPASPCDGLGAIEKSEAPCVFIGKPCDTAAVMQLRARRPALDQRLGLVLAFFCAGTPSTRGTLDLLEKVQAQRDTIDQLRYRGEGWPGGFTVVSGSRRYFLPYAEAWGALTRYVQFRCRLCPDGLGRLADISCGDAWEQHDSARDNPGTSIVLVRTRRGQEILRRAMAAGYVQLTRVAAEAVLAAQPSLLSRRRELFGRFLAMRLLLIPVPTFRGFSLWHSWVGLPLLEKVRTLAGTFRRALTRGWWKPRRIENIGAETQLPHAVDPCAVDASSRPNGTSRCAGRDGHPLSDSPSASTALPRPRP